MVIESVAPSRIDLAGGTLDIYPLYLFEEGGLTINAAITVWSKVRLTTNGDGHVRLVSLDSGLEQEARSVDELALGGPLDLIARLVKFYRPPLGVTIETHNDAPHGSGLGASSSLLIATTGALLRLNGTDLDPIIMVGYSANLEAQNVRVPTGKQDYYPACFGGLNAIRFEVDGDVVERLDVGEEFLQEFEDRLVLSFTGECRFSGTSNWNMLKMYIDDLGTTRANMRAIKATAAAMREAFVEHDLDRFGHLLDEEWANRCRLAEGVTNDRIERLMAAARDAGAVAGRVCGAGGGGCMTTFTGPGCRPAVEAALTAEGAEVIPYRIAREGLAVQVVES
jgi:D-glycero-alpha-D-manno-heptose-7-phosphate kinase